LKIGQYGFASHGCLTLGHQRHNPIRQIDIDPASEADKAHAPTDKNGLFRLYETDNSPCDQAGNLDHADTLAIALDDKTIALIVFGGLVELRIEELAGIGARFTWTLNTFMNTEIRVNGSGPSPSAGGGTARLISEILPSAGEITRPGLVGVTRGGSRKKRAHQMVSATPTQNRGDHPSQPNTSVTPPKMAMNGVPSLWIGGTARRMESKIVSIIPGF
jgi:hypothetical protein